MFFFYCCLVCIWNQFGLAHGSSWSPLQQVTTAAHCYLQPITYAHSKGLGALCYTHANGLCHVCDTQRSVSIGYLTRLRRLISPTFSYQLIILSKTLHGCALLVSRFTVYRVASEGTWPSQGVTSVNLREWRSLMSVRSNFSAEFLIYYCWYFSF